MKRIWTYYGTVTKIHDGDTFDVDLDLGLYLWRRGLPVRVSGINAPELSSPDGSGKAALAYLSTLLKVGDVVRLDSIDGKFYEKYGRLLAKPYTFDPSTDAVVLDLGAAMIAAGHAVAYNPA